MMAEHEDTCTGLHDPAHPSCFDDYTLPVGGRFIERCDEISAFDDDGDAAEAVGLKGAWVECSNGGAHYLVGCTPEEAKLEAIEDEGGQS